MKYRYLYQTRENETREGWIRARDRADAYARLRKQQIRPFRVIGRDPIRWQPWTAGFIIFALAAVSLYFIFRDANRTSELPRAQIVGDSDIVSSGVATEWHDILATKLDRYLAAYVQPGWIALPPEVTADDIANFPNDLKTPLDFERAKNRESVMLLRMVASMRREMADYLSSGGTVQAYLEFLDERQDQERMYRQRAVEAIARAPESMRESVWINTNTRLRGMGLPQVEKPSF